MHGLKTLYQLSQGFVGAEESQVKVLPEDVEGDAPFGLRLINLASVIYSQFSIDAVRVRETMQRSFVYKLFSVWWSRSEN